jgi:hypothetical protein
MAVNAFVGAMVGIERSILPLLATSPIAASNVGRRRSHCL